jgi:transposase
LVKQPNVIIPQLRCQIDCRRGTTIFTVGLRRDQAAVAAALSCEWSNGQTEGQINRLKTIKRQMYGRANFDLLRARVLHRAQA